MNRLYSIYDDIADIAQSRLSADWHVLSSCIGMADVFYSVEDDVQAQAKVVCSTCPVTDECRAAWETAPWAQRVSGVWFGTTPKERRSMNLQRSTY